MDAAWIAALEGALAASPEADAPVLVAAAAGGSIPLDPDESHAAARRALLLHAAGGDALRAYALDGRAVAAAAADLDASVRRDALARGLAELAEASAGSPRVAATVAALRADSELAWRAWICGVLVDAVEAG